MDKSSINKIVSNHIANIQGTEFEEFCNRFLYMIYGDEFQTTRAGGPKGDMVNDGYCYSNRIFFQFYATRGERIDRLKDKINSSLNGCLEKQLDVKKFVFITNDKNIGEVERFIDELRIKRKIDIETWSPVLLLHKIRDYSIENIEYILGFSLSDKNSNSHLTVKYRRDYSHYEKHLNNEIKIDGLLCIFDFIGSLILLFIGIYFFTLLILIFALFCFFFALEKSIYFSLWIKSSGVHEQVLIGDKFILKKSNGDCILYSKIAKCPWQNCNGIIELQKAPEQEKELKIIGCCDMNSYTHTYTIDSANNGYYQKMNFKPLNKE